MEDVNLGILRIGRDLKVYEKTSKGWKISDKEFRDAMAVIEMFKSHRNFDYLIDPKDPKFLKGFLTKDGKVRGARIRILPDGRSLDKTYSLFSKNLRVHDETSNKHWDVMYQNPGGKYAYVYTLQKRNESNRKKYDEVREFGRIYNRLKKRVLRALKDKSDPLALSMYTLLETYMRVGNEIYYRINGHEGLTTLKKKDISIKGNEIRFNYPGKDGVPVEIEKNFPDIYVRRLKEVLRSLKDGDFVFLKDGRLLKEKDFKEAFFDYCGEEFYPHIVRSFHATLKAKEFLKKHKKASKKEVKELFLSIAHDLGHRKFSKKYKEWEDSPNITIHYYIQPEILEKINKTLK